MFVDASAIVAIISEEPEWEALAAKIDMAREVMISGVAYYEAVLGMTRKWKCELADAKASVDQFLVEARAMTIDVDHGAGLTALEAFNRFGKGRHKAALNMGDCFAYACAQAKRVPLLCKGDDFKLTDIRLA